MATFNGWTILPMPVYPAVPRSVEWQANDTVALSTNPFTGQQQVQNWGASWLEASLSYQPMTHAQAVAWVAWLMALQGTNNIFQFGDPLATGPQNPSAVAPTVSGANQTGYSLVTAGGSGLSTGDWIQVGYRLYRLTSVAGSTLGIWPQLRESPDDGAVITIANTQGIWRLKTNQRKWSVRETKTYGIQFEIREAL